MPDKINSEAKSCATASERATGIKREDWLKQFRENMQCYPGTRISLLQGPKQIQEQAKIIRKARHSFATHFAYCNTAKERKEAKTTLKEVEDKLAEIDRALPMAEKRESENEIKRKETHIKVEAEIEARREEEKEVRREREGRTKKAGLLDMLMEDLN